MIRILNMFKEYLKNSENWSYQLLRHLPRAEIVIASKRFLPCNFHPPEFEYIQFPLRKTINPHRHLHLRLFNILSTLCLRFYPAHVRKMCGPCDVMHSHFAFVGWEYRRLAQQMGIPHVVSFYGYDYQQKPFLEPVWKERYRDLFNRADLFICEGGHGARMLREAGCPERKIRVNRLGVDVKAIPFVEREKRAGELHLLQIAAFTGKKGQKYALEAFEKALVDCPDMTLTFVGGEDYSIKKELMERAKNSIAGSRVFFFDAIDYSKLYEFMKGYHVFIHPSTFTETMDCEGGAPIVLLDAQASGMPVISTLHCDIPDEVVHGETGLLSPERDGDGIAESIRAFYAMDQGDYDSFALNGRNHVARTYDIRKNSAKLRSLYDEVIREGARRAR